MPRGGYRPGAGRKPGTPALKPETISLQVMPPMETPDISPDATPLEFLVACMRDERLTMTTRMQAAALALPFAHAKPVMGIKDARKLAAFDDDDDDRMARAVNGH